VRAEGHVPYAPRVAPTQSGWARVVLVQTIAGPLAGDRVLIDVDVGVGAALEVVGNAATLAYPSSSPARHEVRVRLGAGARLAWLPEPLILAADCNLESSIQLELDTASAAFVRELLVLGRHRERPGRYRSRLRCELEGRPLLHEAVDIDREGASQSSRAVLAGAGALASLALLGLLPEEACGPGELALAGTGRVLRALAPDAASLRVAIAQPEALYRETLGCGSAERA
jgi:urease accessory protein